MHEEYPVSYSYKQIINIDGQAISQELDEIFGHSWRTMLALQQFSEDLCAPGALAGIMVTL